MSRRYDDWPERLTEVIERYRNQSFAWGESDCGTFATDCVREITGVELYSEFRGRYTDLKSYISLLRNYECDDVGCLFDVVGGAFNFESINPRLAQRGDVCLYSNDQSLPSLGVCTGIRAMFHTEQGLLQVLMSDVSRAWRIE